jgi:hypothetical protein
MTSPVAGARITKESLVSLSNLFLYYTGAQIIRAETNKRKCR